MLRPMTFLGRSILPAIVATVLCAGCQTARQPQPSPPQPQSPDQDQQPPAIEQDRHHHQAPARDLTY